MRQRYMVEEMTRIAPRWKEKKKFEYIDDAVDYARQENKRAGAGNAIHRVKENREPGAVLYDRGWID